MHALRGRTGNTDCSNNNNNNSRLEGIKCVGWGAVSRVSLEEGIMGGQGCLSSKAGLSRE